MTSPPVLELNNVSLSYLTNKSTFDRGVHRVLDNVSMTLRDGETLGLIGKNGCGKTTILRLMAGILAPTSGVVTQRQGVTSALLTLGLGFKPNLSGRDNVVLSAMLQGSTQGQAKAYANDIKDFAELGDSFEEPVKTYSAGMRSRLGFTTALLTDVDIMLIDEILSVGDAQFRKKAGTALKDRINGNQTVVFVSHNEAQVAELCETAIWLDKGKIASQGTVEEVLDNYKESLETVR
jgi:lipopolysaccharide transport system ATP-binding protein